MAEKPITDPEIARIVGQLQGQTGALQTSVGQLHSDIRAMRADLTAQHTALAGEIDVIREAVSEDKGKWRVLAGVSGIAATVAGAVVAVAQWLFMRGA